LSRISRSTRLWLTTHPSGADARRFVGSRTAGSPAPPLQRVAHRGLSWRGTDTPVPAITGVVHPLQHATMSSPCVVVDIIAAMTA
jgi:hypothetical protein